MEGVSVRAWEEVIKFEKRRKKKHTHTYIYIYRRSKDKVREKETRDVPHVIREKRLLLRTGTRLYFFFIHKGIEIILTTRSCRVTIRLLSMTKLGRDSGHTAGRKEIRKKR